MALSKKYDIYLAVRGAVKMALSKTTRDHDEIRKWAESRGAVPAEVASTEQKGEPGILRFEFPNAPNRNDSKLKEISWDDFFEKFDETDLELLYQEKTADGQKSNFNKLVHPSSDEHSSRRNSGTGPSQSDRSKKSAGEDKNESRSGSRSSKSHSSSAGATQSAGGNKASARHESDMEDEDSRDEELDDDFEEAAGADDLDDNGEPRQSSDSSHEPSNSSTSSRSSSRSSSQSSGTKSQSTGAKKK